MSQPLRSSVPKFLQASRMAMISACAVGSVCSKTQLPELPAMRVPFTTTAPNGPPLPASSACSAKSTAICMYRLRAAAAAVFCCWEDLFEDLLIFLLDRRVKKLCHGLEKIITGVDGGWPPAGAVGGMGNCCGALRADTGSGPWQPG